MALSWAILAALLFAPQQDFLAEGLKALDANQPAAAEPLLRRAIEASPGDYGAHFSGQFYINTPYLGTNQNDLTLYSSGKPNTVYNQLADRGFVSLNLQHTF